ncbi:rod shape-determining protein MreD [Patulibacter minatonensis]|uniref:rod shape-determining protein MreD n=1 Tax=Patulibacter minatonensis TaxID=298163 RepID=UPI00047C0BFF|nr:rod shape-determining protein MreD [Patulibacter minatonensis]
MNRPPTVRRSGRRRRRRPRLPDHAALGPKPVLRLVLLGFLVAMLQLSFFGRVQFLGMGIDLGLLSVLMVALLAGPVSGIAYGFGVGLLIDQITGQTSGITSLVYVVVAYAAGRLGEMRDPESSVVPVVIGLFGTAAGLLVYSFVELLLTQGVTVNVRMVWVIGGTSLIDALIALPVHNRTRAWLLPMLPEEARRRRRRRNYGRRSASSDIDVRIR